MGYKIYAPKPIDEYCMKLLEKKGFEFIGVWKDSREDMKKYMSECDVAIARVHFFDDELLGLASHMKLLEVHGVGYQDHVICEDAAKRGIYVAYSPYGNHTTVAEGAVGLTIAMTKHICEYNTKVRTPEGIKAKMAMEIEGCTVGVLGFGNIARSYAQKMHYGLDANIIAYDPYVDDAAMASKGVERAASLDDLCARSDYISVHTPLTAETKGLIGQAQFAKMKPGAIVINCARGGVVDECAARDALKSGHLGGLSLDVLEGALGGLGDNAHLDSDLFGMEHFTVSPHIGGSTHEAYDGIGQFIVEKVAEFYDLSK